MLYHETLSHTSHGYRDLKLFRVSGSTVFFDSSDRFSKDFTSVVASFWTFVSVSVFQVTYQSLDRVEVILLFKLYNFCVEQFFVAPAVVRVFASCRSLRFPSQDYSVLCTSKPTNLFSFNESDFPYADKIYSSNRLRPFCMLEHFTVYTFLEDYCRAGSPCTFYNTRFTHVLREPWPVKTKVYTRHFAEALENIVK